MTLPPHQSEPVPPEGDAQAPVAKAIRPFSVLNEGALDSPLVLAVPHGGRDYAPDLLAGMRDPAATPLRLEDRHADTLARVVAEKLGAPLLVAHLPRAAIDLNRAEDDIDWSMIAGGGSAAPRHSAVNRRARSGLGLVPRRLPGSGEIWKQPLARSDLRDRIAQVHRPYHFVLEGLLRHRADHWGAALLVDIHSMPPLARSDCGGEPAVCVVGDRFGASCSAALSAAALQHLGAAGLSVAHNRPYAGGYVLERHGRPRHGIHALQLEICRASYLDAACDRPGPGFDAMASVLSGLLRRLAAETAILGRGPLRAEAAE